MSRFAGSADSFRNVEKYTIVASNMATQGRDEYMVRMRHARMEGHCALIATLVPRGWRQGTFAQASGGTQVTQPMIDLQRPGHSPLSFSQKPTSFPLFHLLPRACPRKASSHARFHRGIIWQRNNASIILCSTSTQSSRWQRLSFV